VKHLSGAPLLGRLLALPTNIILEFIILNKTRMERLARDKLYLL
jgi:hypothetical protein